MYIRVDKLKGPGGMPLSGWEWIGVHLASQARFTDRVWRSFRVKGQDCDVYMEQPEGFAVGDARNMICLLRKSIYGTKQGGNRWNQKMRSVLESIGYTQSYSDASIYIYVKDNVRITLPVFVDSLQLPMTLHDLGPTTQLPGINDWAKVTLL